MVLRHVHNSKGTSLIEILISLLLMAIVFSGLIKSSILVANQNVENLMRDEAVSIAEDRMGQARNVAFDSLVSGSTVTIFRDFRGIQGFEFGTTMTVLLVDTNNKQVAVTVNWSRKGISYNHNILTVVRRT